MMDTNQENSVILNLAPDDARRVLDGLSLLVGSQPIDIWPDVPDSDEKRAVIDLYGRVSAVMDV